MLSHCHWHWQLFTTLGNVNTSACQTLLYPGWYIQIQFVRFFGIYYQHKSYFGGRRKKRAKLFSPQQPEFWQFFVCQSSKRELLGGDFFNRAWLPWVSTTNRQQWWNRHFIESYSTSGKMRIFNFLALFYKSFEYIFDKVCLLQLCCIICTLTFSSLIQWLLHSFITVKLLSRQCKSAIRHGKRGGASK